MSQRIRTNNWCKCLQAGDVMFSGALLSVRCEDSLTELAKALKGQSTLVITTCLQLMNFPSYLLYKSLPYDPFIPSIFCKKTLHFKYWDGMFLKSLFVWGWFQGLDLWLHSNLPTDDSESLVRASVLSPNTCDSQSLLGSKILSLNGFKDLDLATFLQMWNLQ